MAQTTHPEKETKSGIAGWPMAIAALALLVWVAFLVVMTRATDSGETEWTRLAYIFTSVEAIAFAAAGALFGVTVQRERVKEAESKADANQRDAANGRALAIANMADGGELVDADEDSTFESFGPAERPSTIQHRHAELARRLFPDLP